MIKSIFFKAFIIYLLHSGLPAPISGQSDTQPVELGEVKWIRNFEEGVRRSKAENKMIFLLFQEVPGCATCQNYGKEVLSHPLIAEAIESLFIPVAIFNNKKGEDAEVLKYYNEPSWNNPVVRIVNSQKQNVIPRVSGNYSPLGLVQAMTLSLKQHEQTVPLYLELLLEELLAQKNGTETATFAMYCFWTGEKTFGKIAGVTATEAGFMEGKEVVEVTFDPSILSYETLLKKAKKSSCAAHVFTENKEQAVIAEQITSKSQVSPVSRFKPDKAPKFYLSKTVYRHVPMTSLQAAKANSLAGEMKDPDLVLSPQQKALAQYFRAHPNKKFPVAINQDITIAWKKVAYFLTEKP